jgi:hypothetical protein
MAIGVYVAQNVKVNIGEMKEQLLFDLDKEKIAYSVPFDKTNTEGIKETIITMRDPDVEISVDNDIISFIKTDNTDFSNLDNVKDVNVNIMEHLKKIYEKLNEKFDTQDSLIKIEKIDTKTLNITVIIISGGVKVRVQIVRDAFGDVYINTIRKI